MTKKSTFINPFHFVPPAEKSTGATPRNDVNATLHGRPKASEPFMPAVPEMLHDRYLARYGDSAAHFSGRIVCRLTTRTPCVFGNEHRVAMTAQTKAKGSGFELVDSTQVKNLSIDGYTAIAATTLKGMFSTIAEMASGSAMRVLNNRALSIRSTMGQSRSALGMIVVEQGRRKLLPLCLPTFSASNDDPKTYRPTYRRDDAENAIWHEILMRRKAIEPDAAMTAIYVQKNVPDTFCFHCNRAVVALPGKYRGLKWDDARQRPAPDQDHSVRKGKLLRPVKNGSPYERGTPYSVVERDPDAVQTLGIVRSLRIPAVRPPKLWFSMFLPICPSWCNADGKFELPEEHRAGDKHLLLESEEACAAFDAIVAHPHSNAPPDASCTVLRGQRQFKLPKLARDHSPQFSLKDGDLVFFVPESADKVASVAISGIWREGPRWLWDPETGEPDLLGSRELRPMHAERQSVTLAEKLFGWVSDTDVQGENGVGSYKGRIRFSDAISTARLHDVQLRNNKPAPTTTEELRDWFPLKILASPKPPCPELYMRDAVNPANRDIRRDFPESANSNLQVQGWKFYVLDAQALDSEDSARWQTAKPTESVNQKCWVRPIRPGAEYWFHVDFENLTRTELALLCYALRPTDDFIHRCGFGKPLQLGGVEVEPLAIAYVDRVKRYTADEDLLRNRQRYSQVVGEASAVQMLSGITGDDVPRILQNRGYDRIVRAQQEMTTEASSNFKAANVRELAESFAEAIEDRHQIMTLVGSPIDLPEDCMGVTYPPTVSQDAESEHYRWFVANRDNRSARLSQPPLEPLTDASESIPTLRTNPR